MCNIPLPDEMLKAAKCRQSLLAIKPLLPLFLGSPQIKAHLCGFRFELVHTQSQQPQSAQRRVCHWCPRVSLEKWSTMNDAVYERQQGTRREHRPNNRIGSGPAIRQISLLSTSLNCFVPGFVGMRLHRCVMMLWRSLLRRRRHESTRSCKWHICKTIKASGRGGQVTHRRKEGIWPHRREPAIAPLIARFGGLDTHSGAWSSNLGLGTGLSRDWAPLSGPRISYLRLSPLACNSDV